MPTASDEPVESSTDSDGQLEGETEGFQLEDSSYLFGPPHFTLPRLILLCPF